MYRCDCHLHTRFSFDGAPDSTAEAICRAALDVGLNEITFTDHCDINGEVEHFYDRFDVAAAREAVMAARAQFSGRLVVNWGVELGQPHQYPAEAAALLAAGGFDFVLGSLHNLTAVPDYYYMRFDIMPDALIHQLFARHLEELLALVRFPGVNALAHLTYPMRYIAGDGRTFDAMQHKPAFERLFAEMVARDVALEVNYSPLRNGMPFTMPDEALVRLYRDCGGTRITLGSDAHKPADVAACLEEAVDMLQRCGFTSVVTYRGGQPYVHPLV